VVRPLDLQAAQVQAPLAWRGGARKPSCNPRPAQLVLRRLWLLQEPLRQQRRSRWQ